MTQRTDDCRLPHLTAGLEGTGGTIKERPDDFRVDEIPLYPACGEGTHVYFRVRKAGIPTPQLVREIAREMDARAGEVGLAGLKDARAVTTQWMSLEHADPERLAGCRGRHWEVVGTARHTNKLRRGHLAGNRFTVRVRGLALPADRAVRRAEATLDVLTRRGVPNFFGPQRFGARGDTADLGEALVRDDPEEFLAIFLGRPRADDPPAEQAARDAFDAGDPAGAMDRWPRRCADQRRALSAYRKLGRAGAAVAAVDRRMKSLFASAFQSRLFNDVLRRRLDTLDRVLEGDLARKTDTGGVFRVEDVEAEQQRAAAFEISPTGPIVGYRSRFAEGEPGDVECAVLAEHRVTPEDFRRVAGLKLKGARRALRFGAEDVSVDTGRDEHGEFLELRFLAPPGCYATVLVAEVTKSGAS